MYYNTTAESGQTLTEARAKAKTQDEIVRDFFKGGGKFTARMAHRQLMDLGRIHNLTPITSIRRSMTDLCNEGYLLRLPEKCKEVLGKPNYYYQRAGN